MSATSQLWWGQCAEFTEHPSRIHTSDQERYHKSKQILEWLAGSIRDTNNSKMVLKMPEG